MSEWNHALCLYCYKQAEPGREPVRLKDPLLEVCCKCSAKTVDGIYYRDDPNAYRHCQHSDD